ncbi:17979_t:CDS:2 [Entrophospora sp. SA101]|nr:17979_t:CDS:2 [Entrophospora sp. SA101]
MDMGYLVIQDHLDHFFDEICEHDVLTSNNNNDTNEIKVLSATDNEHIKHEIINSNTSMDNDSTAEGSNDSCSGESNLTKSNNYGFGYVTKHLNGLI